MLAADSLILEGVEVEQPTPSKLCSLCGLMVKNPRDHALNVHSGDGGDNEVFKCDSCDFSHTNKKAVSAHKRTKHSDRAKRECPECDYKTHSKVDLFQQSSDVFAHRYIVKIFKKYPMGLVYCYINFRGLFNLNENQCAKV